ncbi:DUF4386 family protein [Arthrobacter sp. NPDC056727]|uniref:DUF4386 family protein n=1 Tax=Arthrobacter sp. NPDC056727 TaxID=3345927 RepID=UPI00366DBD74
MDTNHVPAGRNSDGGPDRDGGPGARRLAAVLMVSGVVVSFAAGALHPEGANANDHSAAFAEYARSDLWIGVHLGQFVGMAALIAGLLVLGSVAGAEPGRPAWAARLGSWAAAAALALYGALQAVDGVALKHSVDAWAAAEGAEKSVRFAAAEDMRWLEWGMRSYQSFALGAALILLGVAVAGSRRFPQPVGYLMGLSGAAYLAQGWIIGAEGFAGSNAVPTLAGIVLILVWTVWLLASSLRRS